MHMPSQALCRWQGTLRQLQGVGGSPPPDTGQRRAAATCSRHAHFAAMQTANGQSPADQDRQAQRNDHGSDRSWLTLVHATSILPSPPSPSYSFSFLSNLSILCIFSPCPSSDVAFVQLRVIQGSGVSQAPPSQAKRGCGAGVLNTHNKQGASIA